MPSSLSPAKRRRALDALGRDQLAEFTAHYDLDVGDRRVIKNHVDARIRARRVDFWPRPGSRKQSTGKPGKTPTTIYDQESNRTTWRMARMNLAIRGIEANLGRKRADNFTVRVHRLPAVACGHVASRLRRYDNYSVRIRNIDIPVSLRF